MGKPLSILLSCSAMLLLLLPTVKNQEFKVAAAEAAAPTPQPQPKKHDDLINGTATAGKLRPEECAPRCGKRCSMTSHKKPCMFFCKKCCAECLCVPAGTFGNKQSCPCYNNWKTKSGGPKCP